MAKQFIATTLMDGYADGPHVTEVQTGIANQGLYGPDDYVLDEGKKAEAQILTNNSVRVFDATFVIQGRRDVMAANAYADVTIANGEQGMYRNDIIVRKYEKDEMKEIENTSFDVIKGTPSSGVATDPEIPTGDIRTGATMHNMALYRVKLEGLNIVALEPMFKVLYNMADIKKELELLNGKLPSEGESYIKFPYGTLMQWGKVESPKGGPSYGIINFMVPFLDKNYSVLVTPMYPNANIPTFTVSIDKNSTDKATAYFRTNNSENLTGAFASWLAIGRWK